MRGEIEHSENPVIAVLTMLFGILVGIMGVVSVLFFGGYIALEQAAPGPAEFGWQTGSELLNNYACRSGEERLVLLGGREDFYLIDAPEIPGAGAELSPDPSVVDPGLTAQIYDRPMQNGLLSQVFPLSGNIESGVMTIRLRPGASTPTDIRISVRNEAGEIVPDVYQSDLASAVQNGIWERHGNLYWADLADLKMDQNPEADDLEETTSVLSELRRNHKRQSLNVSVAGAELIDFTGIAYCEAPQKRSGTALVSSSSDHADRTRLHCPAPGGQACNISNGNSACNEKRPLACFRPYDQARQFDGDFTLLPEWGHGAIKLSVPVTGGQFSTADEVHTYCSETFGAEWRGLTLINGQASVLLDGQIEPGTQVWVDVPGQPHSNCWDLRPEYDEEPERIP